MSLLDALLLEPYRVNIWVAARTDGIAGSGTLNDPYDGGDPDVFDDLMRTFASETTATQGVRVNLGPGTFQTRGYYDDDEGGCFRAAGPYARGASANTSIGTRCRSRLFDACPCFLPGESDGPVRRHERHDVVNKF